MERRSNPIIRPLCRPVTIAGMRKEFFWVSMALILLTFNILRNPVVVAVVGLTCFGVGAWITDRDPQILRIAINMFYVKRVYDSKRFTDPNVRWK